MASSVTFEVKGLRELGEKMRALSADTALKYSRAATAASARLVKKHAVQNIIASPSVRTHNLERSVIVKRIPKGQTDLTSEHIVTVRGRGKVTRKGTLQSGAPYAGFVEFGTVKMSAEPFLYPALARNTREAAEIMRKILERNIIKNR